MYLPTSRSDRRMRKEVARRLARPGFFTGPREMAIAEKREHRGMRVATHDIWLPGARVLLTSPGFGVDTRARVVYCQHLGNDRFAIGLEFLVP